MRRYAFAHIAMVSPDASQPSEVRVEKPDGYTHRLDAREVPYIASHDGEPMPLERALLFLKAGRRIKRRDWGDGDALVLDGGQLRVADTGAFGPLLGGEHLLASDWVVV